jgi:hypothetical protein
MVPCVNFPVAPAAAIFVSVVIVLSCYTNQLAPYPQKNKTKQDVRLRRRLADQESLSVPPLPLVQGMQDYTTSSLCISVVLFRVGCLMRGDACR